MVGQFGRRVLDAILAEVACPLGGEVLFRARGFVTKKSHALPFY